MSEIISTSEANNWSINRIAQAFGMSRDTITRRLSNVSPAGKRGSHPVYALRDAGPAIFLPDTHKVDYDPEELGPKDRKDWYDSELKRIQYEQEMAKLIPADEVAEVVAEVFKKVALSLDTMADVIERDAGLKGKQIDVMQRIIDNARSQLTTDLVSDE